MDPHGWMALAILAAAVLLFLTKWLPLEITALSLPVVLLLTGVVEDAGQALVGFGSHAVIAIAAVFVIGAGLQESGVASAMARGVERIGGGKEKRQLLVICLMVAALSAFMSNAATVAVLLPAVMALARRTKVARSKLLMPLAFAAILGGNLTLIGTAPNLILSDQLRGATGQGFGMFDFALIGGPVVLAGVLYMAFLGWRFLPERRTEDRLREAQLPENLARHYGLSRQLTRMRVGHASTLLGQTLAESRIRSRFGLSVVLVERQAGLGARSFFPSPEFRFQRGDDLYVEGEQESAWMLAEEESLRIGLAGEHHVERILDHGVSLGELTLAPRSEQTGKTVRELDFRKQFGLNVLALWRGNAPVREGLADIPLQIGDALLVAGPSPRLRELARNPDFVALTQSPERREYRKAPLATLLLLVAVAPVMLGWTELAVSALASAILMTATGCVSMRGVRRSVDWTVLLLIIGTLPLGSALEEQGLVGMAADGVTQLCGDAGPFALLGILFLMAAVASNAVNNAAAAVILAPVAMQAAAGTGIEVRHALLAVAYGCSCAFLIPFSHQCNLMVLGPGGYRSRDFLLMGGGLTLVTAATAVIGLALL